MVNEYPKEIIPQVNFVHSLNVESLLACYPNLAVSRRVKGDKGDAFVLFNGKEQLKDSLMGQVANMSVNLLGALFEDCKHLPYSPLGSKDWNGEEVHSEDLDDNFTIEERCFPIYFYVRDIHNYPFSGDYYFQRENEAIVFLSEIPKGDVEKKYVEKFNKQEPVVVKTHALLNHAPTIFNYWHCVLDSYPNLSSDSPIPTNCKGAQKRIVKTLKSVLIKLFLKTDLKIDYKIEPKFYMMEKS